MDIVVKLLLDAFAGVVVAERMRKAGWRAALLLAVFGFAALAATAALGCAMAALWLGLAPRVTPLWASAIVAGVLLAFALVLCAVGRRLVANGRRRAGSTAAVLPPGLDLGRLFAAHKGTLLLAALIAGMLSDNIGRRR